MKITIELNEQEVTSAIKEYLEKRGHEVKDVKLEVGNIAVGHGSNESTRPGFKHARCEVSK